MTKRNRRSIPWSNIILGVAVIGVIAYFFWLFNYDPSTGPASVPPSLTGTTFP
jgi:hypothetical protein